MSKVVHTSGKRKRAIARATVKTGMGKVKINRQLLNFVHPEIAKMRIEEPLLLSGELAKKVDISVNIIGGGWSSQAEAARLAIARALVEFSDDKTLHDRFLKYDRSLLIADTRYKEQRKPLTHSHARSRRQLSKR